MKITECIDTFVKAAEVGAPIFTDDLYQYVAAHLPTLQRDVLNTYVQRYSKINPLFVRLRRGIYYKTTVTPFGKAGIRYAELVKRVYLSDGGEVFGYETGPSFMNKIGLTTQMPRCIYIATDRPRSQLEGGERIKLVKPVTAVTKENYRYLQFLDLLANHEQVAIEAPNRQEILRHLVEQYGLGFEPLVHYARFYKSDRVYRQLGSIARGEAST